MIPKPWVLLEKQSTIYIYIYFDRELIKMIKI
jgi:hypothetical protein